MPLTSNLYLFISLASCADYPIECNVLTFQHPIFILTFGLVNDVVSLRLPYGFDPEASYTYDVIIHWSLGHHLPVAISSTSWLLEFLLVSITSFELGGLLALLCRFIYFQGFPSLSHRLVSPAQCTGYQGEPWGGEVRLSVFTVEHTNAPYTLHGITLYTIT